MKYRQLLTLVLFTIIFNGISTILTSQNKSQIKFYNRVYGDDDNDFDVMSAEGKWPDAAAIILCEKMHISVQKILMSSYRPVDINGIVRRRVLIQNNSKLEEFSQYYFQQGETVGLKVVKPSGKEIEVSLSDAIEVKKEVPSFYRRKYIKSSYFKIAIPNLEVGDILEYYNVFKYQDNSVVYYEGLFSDEYPTLKKELTFDLTKIDRVYFNTYNTDNKFEFTKGGGKNKKGKDRKHVNRLRYVDYNIEPRPEDRFINEYVSLPYFKVCAYSEKDFFPFLKEGSRYQNKFDINDKYILKLVQGGATKAQTKSFDKRISKSMGVEEREFLPEAFFYCSRLEWNSDQTPNYFHKAIINDKVDIESLFRFVDGELSSSYFLSNLSKYLEKYDFEHEYLVIVPQSRGGVDNVLSPGDVLYGIYVNEVDQYYWPTNCHRNNTETPLALTKGGVGYRFKVFGKDGKKMKRIRGPKAVDFVLPPISSEDAGEINYLDVSISEEMDVLNVKDSTIIIGPYKAYYYSLLPKYKEFINSDHLDMYENDDVVKERNSNSMKLLSSSYSNVSHELRIKSNEIQKEAFENNIKGTFNSEEFELKDFEIYETGRTFHERNMIFNQTYELKDFINKAGPNYILKAGSLIGEQRKLTDEELGGRDYDADLGYAKKFENHIRVTIPEGYVAKGIDQLNTFIDNEFLLFNSTATLEGQTLVIHTTKEYKKSTVPKDLWGQVVSALEEAYNFSKKKIILSKL